MMGVAAINNDGVIESCGRSDWKVIAFTTKGSGLSIIFTRSSLVIYRFLDLCVPKNLPTYLHTCLQRNPKRLAAAAIGIIAVEGLSRRYALILSGV